MGCSVLKRWSAFLLALTAILASAAPGQAAFPGADGKIAFGAYTTFPEHLSIYTINSDGTGITELTTTTDFDVAPEYSPTGDRIVFSSRRDGNTEVYVMNADGTAQTRITNTAANESQPAWSPDGERIAFTRGSSIFVMNADGTGESPLTTGSMPAWAPDGSRIAFADVGQDSSNPLEVFVVDHDGTDRTQVTPSEPPDPPYQFFDRAPDWTPDGSRIAFVNAWSEPGSGEFQSIRLIKPDGTGQTTLAELGGYTGSPAVSPEGTRIAYNDSFGIRIRGIDGFNPQFLDLGTLENQEQDLDWQPIPVNAYARPKSAPSQKIALVTAYERCTAPDRVHGPPLAFDSCSAPHMTSDEITVGTEDSNGLAPDNHGYLNLRVIVGNPVTPDNDADVRVELFVNDLFDKSTLEPYHGNVQVRFKVRITDKANTPHPGGPGAGTTVTIPFEMTAQTCEPGAPGSPPQGSACLLISEFNAILPGAVKEGGRAIWEVDDVELWDGGADGDADTTADNSLFAVQGVFVP